MKQSQWTVAVVVLAVMVFAVTFAMNYLGGTSDPTPDRSADAPQQKKAGYLKFDRLTFPPERDGKMVELVERELHQTGHIDYWFANPTEYPVTTGLDSKGCRCTSVIMHVFTGAQMDRMKASAASFLGIAGNGPLATILHEQASLMAVQSGVEGVELMKDDATNKLTVPEGGGGWVRLGYKAEKQGAQRLVAALFIEKLTQGSLITLQAGLYFHEPIRIVPVLDLGTVRDENLDAGLAGVIIAWSSTRPSLDLQCEVATRRAAAGDDPLQIGTPVPFTMDEKVRLYMQNNGPGSTDASKGSITCAYRIPVNYKSGGTGGKKSADLGPFQRTVMVGLKDGQHIKDDHGHSHDEKIVYVTGRVRGVVEIGNDDTSEADFNTFRRSQGKRVRLSLFSNVQGLKLEFDRERTPDFLKGTLTQKPSVAGERQGWQLEAEAVKDKVSGTFPRRIDPTFADSAVYLKASLPDGSVRAIRIAVRGTATEG